jgi:hypothetical protein
MAQTTRKPRRKAVAADVCGQPGGPSAEEQATVDAEQAALIERIKRDRQANMDEERALGLDAQSKVERANQRAVHMQQLPELVADLKAQVAALTAKVEALTNG